MGIPTILYGRLTTLESLAAHPYYPPATVTAEDCETCEVAPACPYTPATCVFGPEKIDYIEDEFEGQAEPDDDEEEEDEESREDIRRWRGKNGKP